MSANSIADQVLLLTGAAGGIGQAIARTFYRLGARMLLADLDESAVSTLALSLDPSRQRVIASRYDASRFEDAESVVNQCVDHFGKIDHLVPAAAIYEEQSILTMSDDQWRRTMAINLDGVFYICRRALPHMPKGGTIVTIASSAAHEGCSPLHTHYGASKGGVLSFSRSLARELAPDIRVNIVSPGTIETPMVEKLLQERGEKFLAITPAGRFGTPEEVASSVAFLCSDESSYILGSVVHVNGGAYMGG